MAQLYGVAIGQHHGALHEVFQLADVAGEGVGAQGREHVRRDVPHLASQQLRIFEHEVPGQQGNVLAPLGQGRQPQGDDIQPVVQVEVEASGLGLHGQILVGGGDDPHVHGHVHGAAHAQKFAFLQHAQKPHLHGGRHLAHLVEEQRAALGGLEQAGLALHGAGVRALLVAEELAGQQLLAEGPAVDRQKAFARALAGLMDGARHQFLAGAGLAQQQHCGRRGGHLRDGHEQTGHGRAFAHEHGRGVAVLQTPAQVLHLVPKLARLHGLGREGAHLVEIEGFGQIGERAPVHGLHRAGHRGVAGHDHHFQRGVQLARALHEADAVLLAAFAQAQVGQQQFIGGLGQFSQGRARVAHGEGLVAGPGEGVGEVLAGDGLVVHHQNAARAHVLAPSLGAAAEPAGISPRRAGRESGRRRMNRAPWPGSLSTEISP